MPYPWRLPMIRFGCPSCKTVLSAPPEQAGTKVGCPRCGQRLLVPQPPPPNKTLLGALLPQETQAAPRPSGAAGPVASAPPQAQPWFFLRAGQRHGPVTWEQLRQMTAAGQIQPADLVWTNAMP